MTYKTLNNGVDNEIVTVPCSTVRSPTKCCVPPVGDDLPQYQPTWNEERAALCDNKCFRHQNWN